jgi:hypothetical protein
MIKYLWHKFRTLLACDALRRIRVFLGLLTKADRCWLYERRRRVFNLGRPHAHPATLPPAKRHGLGRTG